MPPVNHFRNLNAAMLEEWRLRTPNDALRNAYMEHNGNRYWWVYDASGGVITNWESRPFPGCASLVTTTQIELRENLRGRGLGTYFHEMRQRAYRRAGFVGEVCTVRADSEAQTAIVAHTGRSLGTFPSDFGGTYNVWLIPLNAQAPAVAPPTPHISQARVHETDFTGYVMTRETPAPTVVTCGQHVRYPAGDGFCSRPLGHLGAHGPNPYIGSKFNLAEIVAEAPDAKVVKAPKKFSHRKTNV